MATCYKFNKYFLHRCTGLTEETKDEKAIFIQKVLNRCKSEDESGLDLFDVLDKRYCYKLIKLFHTSL